MFIMTIPDVPIHATPVFLTQAEGGASNSVHSKNILGVCETAHGKTDIRPTYDAESYIFRFNGKDGFSNGAKATVIQAPKNGKLQPSENYDPNFYWFSYTPKQLPSGTKDSFIISVENNGITVTIRYYIYIDYLEPNEPADVTYCGDKQFWKISFSEEGMFMSYRAQRVRLDCDREASHNLNRLLYKPGVSAVNLLLWKYISD